MPICIVAPSDTAGMAPAGQLWSSLGDLLRWGRCLLGETSSLIGRWWATTTEYEITRQDQASVLVMTPVDDRTRVSSFTRTSRDAWLGSAGPALGEFLHIDRGADGDPVALRQGGVLLKRAPYVDL